MNLRPDGIHATPEAQVASLVIPKQGVSWVVLDRLERQRALFLLPEVVPEPATGEGSAADSQVEYRKPGDEAKRRAPRRGQGTASEPEARPEVVPREQPEAKIEPPRRRARARP